MYLIFGPVPRRFCRVPDEDGTELWERGELGLAEGTGGKVSF